MKRGAWILLISLTLSLGEVLAGGRKDESYLIRRAYLDVLGVVPTINELEWYCVYNTDSYEKAVAWLLTRPIIRCINGEDVAKKKVLLLSKSYREQGKTLLPEGKLEDIIYYLAGYDGPRSEESLKNAKLQLISFSRVYEDGDMQALDRLAVSLMGRETSVDETNHLLRILKCGLDVVSEEESWLNTLEQLLTFEDVTHK